MRNRVGALSDRGREVVAQVVDKDIVDADHQIEERRAVSEDYPEQFGRFGSRIENRVDRDLQFLGWRVKSRLGLGELASEFSRAMLDQLDKNFILGLVV